MKIWWCEEHESQRHVDLKRRCWASVDDAWLEGDCRMVEMRLTEPDALVIEREDGEWPKWAREILHYDVAALAECTGVEILDALAAPVHAETPT